MGFKIAVASVVLTLFVAAAPGCQGSSDQAILLTDVKVSSSRSLIADSNLEEQQASVMFEEDTKRKYFDGYAGPVVIKESISDEPQQETSTVIVTKGAAEENKATEEKYFDGYAGPIIKESTSDESEEETSTVVAVEEALDKAEKNDSDEPIVIIVEDSSEKETPTVVVIEEASDKAEENGPDEPVVVTVEDSSEKETPTVVVIEEALDKAEENDSDEPIVIIVEDSSEKETPTVVVIEEASDEAEDLKSDEPVVVTVEDSSEKETPTVVVIEEASEGSEDLSSGEPVVVVVVEDSASDTNDLENEHPTVVVVDQGEDTNDYEVAVTVEKSSTSDEMEDAIPADENKDMSIETVEEDNTTGKNSGGGVVFIASAGILAVVAVGVTIRAKTLERRSSYSRIPAYDNEHFLPI